MIDRAKRLLAGAITVAVATGIGGLAAPDALAQAYPSKPVSMVVPTAPGGGNDVIARLVAKFIEPRLGQPVVVVNMSGSQNLQGARHVAEAKPDGYTILVTASSPPGFKAIYKEPPVDSLKQFEFVSLILQAPQIIAVNKKHKDLKALVDASRANPNGVVYASYAVGFELMGAVIVDAAGIKSRTAYFSSAQDAAKAVAAGDADFMMASQATLSPWGDQIRAAAITQDKPSPDFPGVPTTTEAGLTMPNLLIWIGMMAPAGTPREIVDRLNREVRAFTADPASIAALKKFGFTAFANSPAEFREFFAKEEALMVEAAVKARIEKR